MIEKSVEFLSLYNLYCLRIASTASTVQYIIIIIRGKPGIGSQSVIIKAIKVTGVSPVQRMKRSAITSEKP